MSGPWKSGLLAVVLPALACTMVNPAFDPCAGPDCKPIAEDGSSGADGSTSGAESESSTDATDSLTGQEESSTSESETGVDTDQDTGTETGTDPMPASVRFEAEYVACRGAQQFGPYACELYAGVGSAAVDTQSDFGELLVMCMIFVLDGSFAGQTITQVSLELHTSDEVWSMSDASGTVWSVAPFTPQSFELELPAPLDKLADGLGPIARNVPVVWDLPPTVAIANATVYLCIEPESSDGAYYYNLAGAVPPALRVDYE